MVERPRRDVSDGYSWWCRQCKTRKSIRAGSFFSKSKLTLQKWLLVFISWARDRSVTDAMDEIEIDSRTAVDIYQWLREVVLPSYYRPILHLVDQAGLSSRLMNPCFAINPR